MRFGRPFIGGEQVKIILFCAFLSKIEGGDKNIFGMKFLSNTVVFGPVFSLALKGELELRQGDFRSQEDHSAFSY